MTTALQLRSEAQSIVAMFIGRGVTPAAPKQPRQYAQKLTDEQRRIHRKQALDRYYSRRDAWVAQGLTSQGKPRVRAYKRLDGMTPDEKKARQRAQTAAWTAARRVA